MAHIHYKFASKRSPDTVIFDGPHITLTELKRMIMEKEKLRSGDCDLQITNAQTKEEFTDNEGLIAKGSSVVVRRIPVIGARSGSNAKIRNIERADGHQHQPFGAVRAMGAQGSSSTLPLFSKMTNLAFADVSEEDKLKVLVNQSLYDSMSYNMKAGPGLPVNYSCFRCGSTGHHIRNCPNSGDKTTEAPLRIKKSTGIPRSFMVEVDDPSIKGAMLTNCGHYAIPAIHAKAYAVGKKEKPPFVPQELPVSKDEDPIPKELLCLICKEMLSDAVVIPCCGNSFCDDCIRTALLDSDQHTCPICKQSNVSPDTLIANKFLRQAVNTFQKDQGQSKSSTGNDGTSQPVNPAWAPDPVLKKKPHQSAHKQQTQSAAQGRLVPPLPTGPAPPPSVTSTPLQPLQTQINTFKHEPEERTCDEAEPSEGGSVTDAAAAAPTCVTSAQVSDSTPEEKPQTVSVTPQQPATDPGPLWPPTYWESTSSPSSCPPSSSSSSSTYPSVPPPLFPSPHFPSFLTAQHHLTSYLPGYPAATPVWSVQPPQGAPIPSLCSSTHDWYKHQREKNETRLPHTGSAHRRSSSRSKSSKSPRSYSRSSSRSRSRSRSVGRSRHHSPYSRRHLHSRSHSSYTSSYGYKRSPTPSSSSSPRLSHHSRSKSPSDHRKKSHHSRQHSKKSSSGSSSSGRRAESGQEGRGSEESHGYDQRAKANSSAELDRQRYQQWKRDYKEWCDKYLDSYVSHFHQLPPLLNLPPSPREDTGENGCSSRVHVESGSHGHGSRSTTHPNDRSTPPRSPSDCCSTASQSSIDGRSSSSHSSNHSRSPASHLSSDGYSTPSKMRAARHTGDGRKDARRHPRSYKDDTPGHEKTSPRQPSEPVQPLVKTSKHLKLNRERREDNNSEKEKSQATKGASRIHSGHSRSDSRSEKPGKRKGDHAETLAETRSSKCLKRSTTEVCKSESQHPSDKRGSGKEKREKKSPPVSERDIWEGGMKVKPQKRISINISLEGRNKEEKNGQTQMICQENLTGTPGEDVQKSDNGGEEKVDEMELSGELGGMDPDEREQSPIWKEDVCDHQDQVTEEQEKKEGWHPILQHEEEEEESKGLQEEHEGMKASTSKELIRGEGKSTEREGRSGGQESREFLTEENASTESESRVEVKLMMETKEDQTRSMSEQDGAEREERGRHGSHGNGLQRTLMVGAPEEHTQDRASGREGTPERVPGSKWQKEESVKKGLDEESRAEPSLWSVSSMEKSTVPSPHCDTAPSSGKERFYSSSTRRDWKVEVEVESDRTKQKEKEGKRSQERRKKEENRRDGEEEQDNIQDNRLHQCVGSLPAPPHQCKDKAAGQHQSPPPLHPHCRGEEKGLLPSGDIKKRENDIMAEKKAWMEKSTDNVIKVCRRQRDGGKRHKEEEKKGGEWTRQEQEEGGRPGSFSASQGSSSERGRNEWMNQTKLRKEKREGADELLEEREKHEASKTSGDGKE